MQRWITLRFVGWGPPYLGPSGASLGSRYEGLFQPHNVPREVTSAPRSSAT
jgi:hypothetical protein